MNTRGFTLIELLVVMTIIGLLASTVLASLGNARQIGRDATRESDIKQLQTALELFRNANNGQYPCATLPGCAGAAAAQIDLKGGTANAAFNTAMRPYLRPFGPDTFLVPAPALAYRVRSTDNTSNNPDRTSYTIVARFETRRVNSGNITIEPNNWCKIDVGPGHDGTWDGFPNCF